MTVVAGAGAAVLAALALFLVARGASDARLYFGTDARAPAILLGAALAAFVAWRGAARSTTGRLGLELVGLLGLVWLVWAWTDLGGQVRLLVRGGLLVSSVAATAVVAAAAHPRRGPIAVVCSFTPFRWLGFVSYGLYLWHWPVFIWLDGNRTGLDGWALTITRVCVSLAIAGASYLLVEQPIRRGARSGLSMRVLAPVTALAVVATLMITTTGAVSRPTTEDTIAEGRNPVASSPPAPPSARRILVVGDSVAYSLGVQFDALEAIEGGSRPTTRG